MAWSRSTRCSSYRGTANCPLATESLSFVSVMIIAAGLCSVAYSRTSLTFSASPVAIPSAFQFRISAVVVGGGFPRVWVLDPLQRCSSTPGVGIIYCSVCGGPLGRAAGMLQTNARAAVAVEAVGLPLALFRRAWARVRWPASSSSAALALRALRTRRGARLPLLFIGDGAACPAVLSSDGPE